MVEATKAIAWNISNIFYDGKTALIISYFDIIEYDNSMRMEWICAAYLYAGPQQKLDTLQQKQV